MRSWMLLAAFCAPVACSLGDDDDDELSSSKFIDEFVTLACEHYFECGGDSGDVMGDTLAECEEEAKRQLSGASECDFDERKGEACLDALRDIDCGDDMPDECYGVYECGGDSGN